VFFGPNTVHPLFSFFVSVWVVHAGLTTKLSLQCLELFSQVSQGWCGELPLVDEVLSEKLDKRNLLLGREASNGGLENRPRRCLVHSDEALVVHEGEEAHDELTVHAVGHTAVAGD